MKLPERRCVLSENHSAPNGSDYFNSLFDFYFKQGDQPNVNVIFESTGFPTCNDLEQAQVYEGNFKATLKQNLYMTFDRDDFTNYNFSVDSYGISIPDGIHYKKKFCLEKTASNTTVSIIPKKSIEENIYYFIE